MNLGQYAAVSNFLNNPGEPPVQFSEPHMKNYLATAISEPFLRSNDSFNSNHSRPAQNQYTNSKKDLQDELHIICWK